MYLPLPGQGEPCEPGQHLAGGGGGVVAVARGPERARVQEAGARAPGVEVAVGLVRAPAPVVAPVVAQPALDKSSYSISCPS